MRGLETARASGQVLTLNLRRKMTALYLPCEVVTLCLCTHLQSEQRRAPWVIHGPGEGGFLMQVGQGHLN